MGVVIILQWADNAILLFRWGKGEGGRKKDQTKLEGSNKQMIKGFCSPPIDLGHDTSSWNNPTAEGIHFCPSLLVGCSVPSLVSGVGCFAAIITKS